MNSTSSRRCAARAAVPGAGGRSSSAPDGELEKATGHCGHTAFEFAWLSDTAPRRSCRRRRQRRWSARARCRRLHSTAPGTRPSRRLSKRSPIAACVSAGRRLASAVPVSRLIPQLDRVHRVVAQVTQRVAGRPAGGEHDAVAACPSPRILPATHRVDSSWAFHSHPRPSGNHCRRIVQRACELWRACRNQPRALRNDPPNADWKNASSTTWLGTAPYRYAYTGSCRSAHRRRSDRSR